MFNRDLKIGQGEKWDISQISQDEISVEDLTKNKNKLIQIFNSFNMNGGETLDNVELLKAMDYFGNLDTDGDGKLSKNELEKGAQYLNAQLSLEGKDAIKSKDLKNFIKNVVKATGDNATVNADDMFSFDEGDLDIQNVTGSRTEENNGVKSTVLTYDDGREVTTNPGGTYSVKRSDEEGTITKYYSPENRILKKTTQHSNNDTEVIDYDGNQKPLKSLYVSDNGQTVSEILYNDGEPNTETVTQGTTVSQYVYRDGDAYLDRKVENKGAENERVSTYSYNEESQTVLVNIKESGIDTERITDYDGVVLKETVKENNKTTQRIYNDDRSALETVTTPEGTAQTAYNADGFRTAQVIQKGNKNYSLQYDGKGNTSIVVQNGESIDAIAKKFGCSREDLLSVNEGNYHGKGKNIYFNVGQEIVVPGQLDADAQVLQGRDSSEVAVAKYRQHQAEVKRDKQLRELGLTSYERAGEKFKYNGVEYTILGSVEHRERTLVVNPKGEVYIGSWDNKILKDDYVAKTNLYDESEKVTLANGQQYAILQDRGDKHGRKIALNASGQLVTVSGGSSQVDMSDRHVLRNDYVEASDLRDAGQANATISGGENITYVKDHNGKVWYWDETSGKCLVKDQHTNMVQQEANAIAQKIHEAADGAGTDEELLYNGVSSIYSREVFQGVNNVLRTKDSDYAGDNNTTPTEALILDEETHGNARKYFRALINNGAMTTEQQAHTVKREMEHELHGGFGITKTADLNEVMQLLPDRETRVELEKQLASEHSNLTPNEGSYVRAYIADDGWNAEEVDRFDANWVKNGAYSHELDQEHRDKVIGRLVFEHGSDESLNAGLDAVDSDSVDYAHLNARAAQVNKEAGTEAYFNGQEAIQTYLGKRAEDNDGRVDADQLSAWNNSLYNLEKPSRVVAEESVHKVKNGDITAMFESSDPAVYDEMEKMIANGDIPNVKSIRDAYQAALNTRGGSVGGLDVTGNAILSGKIDFTDKEVTDYCIRLMHAMDNSYGDSESKTYCTLPSGGQFLSAYEREEIMLKQILTNRPQIIPELKKQVEAGEFVSTHTTTTLADSQTSIALTDTNTTNRKPAHLALINNIKCIVDEPVFLDENGQQITDPERIKQLTETNMQNLQGFRNYVAQLEREHKRQLDTEGFLDDAGNAVAEGMRSDSDRSDVETQYKEAKLLLSRLEAAAQGKLRDSSGNVISVQDLAQDVVNMEKGLVQINSDYKSTIAKAKMGVVLAPVILATTAVSGGAAAAGWGTVGTAIAIGGTTFVTEAGLGALNMYTSETGNTAEARAENLERAFVDGVMVASGSTFGKLSQVIKTANPAITKVSRVGTIAAADVGMGAAGEYVLTGDVTVDGVAYNAIFSVTGSLLTYMPKKSRVKLDDSSLPDNDFLRTTQNGNDAAVVAPENSVGTLNRDKFDNAVDYYRKAVSNADEAATANLYQRAASLQNRHQSRTLQHIVDDEQLMRRISSETNLGELHNLERQVSTWNDSNRNTDGLLDAIHNRQNELRAEGTYTVAARDLDPAVAERAEAALSKAKRHLLPDEISDIRKYIESLTTPAALDNVVNRLQQRGIKLSSGSKLKHTIDTKYAELNATRPGNQTAEQPLIASNEEYINPHERRIITQADEPAAATYTPAPAEFRQQPAITDNRSVVQTAEQPAITPQERPVTSQADAVAQSVSTPRLDRINPGSGRLGGFAKKQITDEVVASINAAKTPQELTALRDKISQKILNTEFRDALHARIDTRLQQIVNKSDVLSVVDDIKSKNKQIFADNVASIRNGSSQKSDIYKLPEGSIIKLYESGAIAEKDLIDIFTNSSGLISKTDFDYFAKKKIKLTPYDTPEIVEARYFNAVNEPLSVSSQYYQTVKHEILSSELDKIAQAASEGKMIIVTGLPGAGKSTVVKEVLGEDIMKSFYSPDADEFKAAFKDYYAGGKGAGLVHKASTTILKQEVMPLALQQKKNIIYQTTGGEETLNKIIEQAKLNGYDVSIVHVNIAPEKSMSRALSRYQRDGRFLDPYVTLGIYNEGSYIPNQIPDVFKNDSRLQTITVYDTNGASPTFVKKIEL